MPDGAIAIENAGTPHVVENIKDSGTLKLTKEVNGRESDSDFETDFYFTVYDGNRYYDKDGSYADLRTVKLHYDSGIADNSLILSLPIGEYVVEEVADADGTPVNSDNFYYHVQINGEDRNEAVIAIEKEQQAECLVKMYMKQKEIFSSPPRRQWKEGLWKRGNLLSVYTRETR